MPDMPEKYVGLPRKSLHEEVVKDMERVDALVDAAGVKPGDAVQVGIIKWKPRANMNAEAEMEILWAAQPVIFLAIDNGRLIFTNSKEAWDGVVAEAKAKNMEDRISAYAYRIRSGGIDTNRVGGIRKFSES